MKLSKKISAAVLALCMIFSLTACADTTWVYNYDGKVITSGVYLAMTVSAYSEAASEVTDTQAELLTQKIEEKPVKDWISDRAKVLCDEYIAVENKFTEMGLSLSESDNNEIDQSVKVIWETYGAMFEENGVGQKSYRMVLENNKKSQLIFSKHYGTDGPEAVTDDALEVHYRENFASVNMLTLSKILPITGEELTDEQETQNNELRELAEKYVERINAKEITFNEAKDEYKHKTEETEHKADDAADIIGDDKETRGLLRKETDEGSDSLQLSRAVFDMEIGGKAEVISDDKGYYVVLRYDVLERPEDFEQMKNSLLQDIKGEDFKKLVAQWGQELSVTVNQPAVDRYNPSKIKM